MELREFKELNQQVVYTTEWKSKRSADLNRLIMFIDICLCVRARREFGIYLVLIAEEASLEIPWGLALAPCCL